MKMHQYFIGKIEKNSPEKRTRKKSVCGIDNTVMTEEQRREPDRLRPLTNYDNDYTQITRRSLILKANDHVSGQIQ